MKSTSRRDHATGVGCVLLLLLIMMPVWLVIIVGLIAPVLVAWLIVMTIVGGVINVFRR
jgi:hypothetical protein